MLRFIALFLLAAIGICQTSPESLPARYVAVVGAGTYPTPLPRTLEDAKTVDEFFRARLGFQDIPPVYDPTESDLRNWLAALPARLSHADEIVVFITGHGTADGAFLTIDGHTVPVADVIAAIFQTNARILVIEHFCFSGSDLAAISPSVAWKPFQEVIASGELEVPNSENNNAETSPFTRALIEYLIGELHDYSRPRTLSTPELVLGTIKSAVTPVSPRLYPGNTQNHFTIDLDAAEKRSFSEAKAQGTVDALTKYLQSFAIPMYAREAQALLEKAEKDRTVTQRTPVNVSCGNASGPITGYLQFRRGTSLGGNTGDILVNERDCLPYVWVPTPLATRIQNGCENLDPKGDYGGYWMTQSEITDDAFQNVMKRMPRSPGFSRRWRAPNYPIVNVSLDNAKQYCAAVGGRLPTDAEWEYAARAQDSGTEINPHMPAFGANLLGICSGDDCAQSDKYTETSPVGKMPSDQNRWMLFDLAGNVSEIVDAPASSQGHRSCGTPGERPLIHDPQSPQKMFVRGGNFSDPADAQGSVEYSKRRAVDRSGVNTAGFRCVVPYGGSEKTVSPVMNAPF